MKFGTNRGMSMNAEGMSETFLVVYDVTPYQLSDSKEERDLGIKLLQDLEDVIGVENRVTASSAIVDMSFESEVRITADNVYDIINTELQERGYTDENLEPLRMVVVRADPEDEIILLSPDAQQ